MRDDGGFPRLYAAASLKPDRPRAMVVSSKAFSAALCRGLIEAAPCPATWSPSPAGFPRLYAAASLKLGKSAGNHGLRHACFPRLYAAASLKRRAMTTLKTEGAAFSAALCRGLIEAGRFPSRRSAGAPRFPRLYAAASLKPPQGAAMTRRTVPTFSAALCRGLIEAGQARGAARAQGRFSAALCRGLIEAPESALYTPVPSFAVFRGFMPRPH